jgi:hypothetical protein
MSIHCGIGMELFGGDENVLKLDFVVAQYCECTKCHRIAQFNNDYFYVAKFIMCVCVCLKSNKREQFCPSEFSKKGVRIEP